MKANDPNHIDFSQYDGNTIANALSAGASKQVLSRKPFKLMKMLRPITVATATSKRLISHKEQYDDYLTIWKNPLHGPYVYAIASTPHDMYAQMLALNLFLHVLQNHTNQAIWHPVYGNVFNDKKLQDDIPFLVLSNIPQNATRNKIERLRDILTQYSNIPRIIVTADADPVTFMWEKLHMDVEYVAYLGDKPIKSVDVQL